MAVKKEMRQVEVKICDFCQSEVASLFQCALCKKDMCMGDGGKKHAAYNLGIYRYAGDRVSSCFVYVCKECAEKKTDLTIGQILEGMFGKLPVSVSAGIEDYPLSLMVDLKFVTEEQVNQARAEVKPWQKPIDILLEKKLVTQAQILAAKAAQFGAKVVVLSDMEISPEVIGLVKPSWAWHFNIIPVNKTGNCLVIAIDDPSELNVIDTLTHLFNAEIDIRVASKEDIHKALKKYYTIQGPPQSPQ